MELNAAQQQALDAYLAVAGAYYAYRAIRRRETIEEIDEDARVMDALNAATEPLWRRCLYLGIPVPVIDAAIEQRYGVRVNR